jgi:hypothetical protein
VFTGGTKQVGQGLHAPTGVVSGGRFAGPRLKNGAAVVVGVAVPVKIQAGKGVHGNWADPDPPKVGKLPPGSSVTVACPVIVVGMVSP